MERPQQASLKDVLPQGYDFDRYFSDDEVQWIKNTFSDKKSVSIIRKIFLPTVHDPELPLEEISKDVWLSGTDWTQFADSHAKTLIVARQEAIKFVLGGMLLLKALAALKPDDPVEAAYKRSKNSNK